MCWTSILLDLELVDQSSTSMKDLYNLVSLDRANHEEAGEVYHWGHLEVCEQSSRAQLEGRTLPGRCRVDVQVPTTPVALHTAPSCTPSNLDSL